MATIEEKVDRLEKALDSEKRFLKIESDIGKLSKAAHGSHLIVLGDTLKIPLNLWTAVVLMILVFGVALLVFTILTAGSPERMGQITTFIVNWNGERFERDPDTEVSTIYNFSTPHEKSLQDLKDRGEPLTPGEEQYYKVDSESLKKFGDSLKSMGAVGYNRWEAIGSGSKPEKHQWVWSVTWGKSNKIKLRQLLDVYKEYFHRNKGVYIEVLNVQTSRKAQDAQLK